MLRRVNEMCLRRDIDHRNAIHSHHRGNKYDLLRAKEAVEDRAVAVAAAAVAAVAEEWKEGRPELGSRRGRERRRGR